VAKFSFEQNISVMKAKKVEELMVRHVKTVTPDQSVSDVRSIFEEEHFRHLPVVEFGQLVGIISRTDLMRITYGAQLAAGSIEAVNELIYESTQVGEVMTKEVKTIETGALASEAARIMLKYQLNAVPVMEDEELVGLITSSDILHAYIEMSH